MASRRVPRRGPSSSLRYIEGTCVILAAKASLPMVSSFQVFEFAHGGSPGGQVSSVIPALRITVAYCSISARMKAANCSGVADSEAMPPF